MTSPANYELYYAVTGNPKNGTVIDSGTVGPLNSGQCENMTYDTDIQPGNYMFRVQQLLGHPGTGELWSDQCSIATCATATFTPTATPARPIPPRSRRPSRRPTRRPNPTDKYGHQHAYSDQQYQHPDTDEHGDEYAYTVNTYNTHVNQHGDEYPHSDTAATRHRRIRRPAPTRRIRPNTPTPTSTTNTYPTNTATNTPTPAIRPPTHPPDQHGLLTRPDEHPNQHRNAYQYAKQDGHQYTYPGSGHHHTPTPTPTNT